MTRNDDTYASPVASAREIYNNQWKNEKKEKEKEGAQTLATARLS